MSSIVQHINDLKSKIPPDIKIIVVSKTKPNEDILEAYHGGHKIFGENRIQDLVQKHEALPKDIEWHMIGHVQTNKVKYIAPFVHLIHAVDSIKLINVINKEAIKNNRTINCLIQIFIAEEETKFGCTLKEAIEIIEHKNSNNLSNVHLSGVMGMATFTTDESQIKNEFQHLNFVFEELKEKFYPEDDSFREISMGMSGDYHIAVKEGSTMVRIGSLIFGPR